MSIFCPISMALQRTKIYVQRRRKKYINSTSLTIKKHFVRFNLHFKQLKKLCTKMKNTIIIMYEALARITLGPESIFMVLYFIYGLAVFTNREALMIAHFSRSVQAAGKEFTVQLMKNVFCCVFENLLSLQSF